ncbi:hypothetical protein BJ508DRAFT_364828 [Ascobolus immersus RN42]|uniref:Uncharacterized protein n=1 Tax=Ascobolus immersus RN42 TaxID=1160509 RepID=A0A3N4I4S8_ASCIM|nr:hypothetical protein BJ508DRAFT_364828 [Ascobolus immersus RN42]
MDPNLRSDAILACDLENDFNRPNDPYLQGIFKAFGEIDESNIGFPEKRFPKNMLLLCDPGIICPESLHRTSELFMMFIISDVIPYYHKLKSPDTPLDLFNGHPGGFPGPFLIESTYYQLSDRYYSGLLRTGQVRIIEAVLRGTINDLTIIMKRNGTKEEIIEALEESESFLDNFVNSGNFRSERLEVFILRYLAEEGVNVDVVRGIREETAEIRKLVTKEATEGIWGKHMQETDRFKDRFPMPFDLREGAYMKRYFAGW